MKSRTTLPAVPAGQHAHQPMPAIVLTYDKNRCLTDHMIHRYSRAWPEHPFVFRVPFQDLPPTQDSDRIEYRKCPADIKGTLLALIDDLDDGQMVYWCIDDKYPITLDVPKIEAIHRWLVAGGQSSVDGLLFCRCRGMYLQRNLTGKEMADDGGNVLYERRNYRQIWIHQYTKVGILRYIVESIPDEIRSIRKIGFHIQHLAKPPSHRLFVTRDNFALFGESTIEGVLTKNCHQSILESKLALPPWHTRKLERRTFMGNETPLTRGLQFFVRKTRYFIRKTRNLLDTVR